MDALILAGGKGTRLRSVIQDRPKVMADINGKPYLTLLFDQLLRAGVQRVILCTGYMGDYIQNYFGNHYHDLNIVYSKEPVPLGTGGAIRHALPYIQTDRVLILNGDSYCNVLLQQVVDSQHTLAQMVLTHLSDSARYGQVLFDDDGYIAQFLEKTMQAIPGWINAGIYVLHKALIESIPAGQFISLERQIFPQWIQAHKLKGYFSTAEFLDIGLPESYAELPDFIKHLSHKRRFVALDRDGTIIKHVHYISNPDAVEFFPDTIKSLQKLRHMNLGLIVVTNQSAIGRGIIDTQRYYEISSRMTAQLAKHELAFDAIYFCPAHPDDNDPCRKPGIGMMTKAQSDFGFDIEKSFVIGDNLSDIQLGHNIGATTILVKTGVETEMLSIPHYVAQSLYDACRYIADQL